MTAELPSATAYICQPCKGHGRVNRMVERGRAGEEACIWCDGHGRIDRATAESLERRGFGPAQHAGPREVEL